MPLIFRIGYRRSLVSHQNVARRDGMGIVMLAAAVKMKKVPRHYFQAVGSGTGGIAAWEAAIRLTGDGRFGRQLPRLHLAQNIPFIPIVNAWNDGRREIIPAKDMPDARNCIGKLHAQVLSNRNPPYGIKGGVFDALTATGGRMYGISTENAITARKIFEDAEGIDIVPAACFAVAALIEAVKNKHVASDEPILLNITGGGEKRLFKEQNTTTIKSEIAYRDTTAPLDELIEISKTIG
jgi:cysteate synthase